MPQFRLTQKFAKDCKIKQLVEPADTVNPLDDWFIDYSYVQRKKVAMITHAKSIFTFFIPYTDAGGAKSIPLYFKDQLKEFFHQHSLLQFVAEVEMLFTQEFVFSKTVNKKILGHMNDFKRCSEPYRGDLSPIDWHDAAERINNMPINAGSRDSSFPIENFSKLLGVNLPKRKNWFTS